MKIDVTVYDDRLFELYDPDAEDAELVQIAADLITGEGPVWHERDNCLYFSNIGAGKTMRYTRERGLELAFNNGTFGNGLCVARDGRLLMCEHATSSLTVWNTDGSGRRVLADYYGDVQLNSPNDVVQRSDGLVYFTDPNFGRNADKSSIERADPSDMRPVYSYNMQTKALTQVANGFDKPNGLCFSADEKTLYVNDSAAQKIVAFDVLREGGLENPRLFAVCKGIPDGMKIDAMGNLLVATKTTGLEWYDAEGKLLGMLGVPEFPLNLAWGDEDFKTLYITCRRCAFRLRTRVAGERYKRDIYSMLKDCPTCKK